MSEKRFKYGRAFPINSDDSLHCITDSEKDKDYFRMLDLVDLLNEQQDTIKKQDIEIKNLNLHIRKLVDESEISQQLMKEYERNDNLEAKIESMVEQHKARLDKLIEKIGEQQATIKDLERKLQICSAHLLSDECCLTDGQIRKIIKEMTNE